MTKNNLFQKSLHELRVIGRQLGVKSVTTLKKKELIENILDIYFYISNIISFFVKGWVNCSFLAHKL